MKLRIKGNSVRLRLLPHEVAALAQGHPVEETTDFGDGFVFRYTILTSPTAPEMVAGFGRRHGSLFVEVPSEQAQAWASDEKAVSLKNEVVVGPGKTLTLLVEKDWACLDRQNPEEGDALAFPHPKAKC